MSTHCPACGTAYGDDARYCPHDGARLERAGTARPPGAAGRTPFTPPIVPPAEPPHAHARVFAPIVAPHAESQHAGAGGGVLPRATDFGKLVGQTLDQRYRIERKIGEGGMSFVYLAHDVVGRQRVAIKILSPSLSQDRNAMARLRREAELGGKLEHPNVCHIIWLGETGSGMVYVVMPYVAGELLCDRTIRLGRLPLDATTGFVRDIAAGLDVAHRMGIIHRDLKPENIMISPAAEGREKAVVMDFGLAKERRVDPDVAKLTATGIVLGTPEFMSPEQLRGKPLDPRTDVYSLALMTFEMLTGKLPFAGRTQQEIMLARLRSDPIPIRTIRPELGFSATVEQVLLRAMSRDPDHRYASAPQFAAALSTAAAGGTVGGSVLGKLFGR